MSTAAAPAPMGYDDAYGVVYNRVYAPVFFSKLAKDFGIRVPEQDRPRMLKMAAQLRMGHDQEQLTKSAGSADFLSIAEQNLEKQLQALGIPVESANDITVKRAASEISLDPEIAKAVMSMQIAATQEAA